jgi:hypothetical protein
VLSPVEVERLASAMKGERDRMLVRLLAYSGLFSGARPCGGALFPAFAQFRG